MASITPQGLVESENVQPWIGELSGREKQILGLCAAGLIDKNIASELNISVNTLRTYWARIRQKSGNLPRAALAAAFVRAEYAGPPSNQRHPKPKTLIPATTDADKLRQTAIYYATALQRVQDSIERTYRASRVLTAYPRHAFTAKTESELLSFVCGILVEEGGYVLSWIGFAKNDDEKTIQITEACGTAADSVQEVQVSWGDNPLGHGPAGTALRTGETQINRDFLGNPAMAPWRRWAVKHGFQSSIAIPVKTGSEIATVVSTYAKDADAFDEVEVRLLEVVADDFGARLAELRKTKQSKVAKLV